MHLTTLDSHADLSSADAVARPARLSERLCALLAAALLVGLGAAQGGYFPTAWGWAALASLWVVGIALVVRPRLRISTAEKGFIAALAVLTGWTALSTAWSVAPAESVLELDRMLVYLTAPAAVLLVSRSRSAGHVLAGLLGAVGVIAIFSLTTRLVPDRVGVFDKTSTYRLAQPIGYWNGLAIFLAMGALLALGFAARARTLLARAACAGILVVLLPTLYFTFGRAGWIALVAGALAAVAFDPRRLQLLATLFVLGPLPAAATWLASRQHGLTHAGSALMRAAHDGHRLALVLLVLALANAGLSVGLALLARGIDVGGRLRRVFAGAVVGVAVLALAGIFVQYGGPGTLARKGYHAFKAPPPHASNDLNRRFLSFSGNGRAALWRLAWDDARRHPWLGAGAGTYERYFLAHQPKNIGRVRDAHGLYVETLAELGGVGLVLLLALLAIPFTAVRAARRHPLIPSAIGAYVAFLVHAGVDWDWELPAVTLAGLLCGASVLIAGRCAGRRPPVSLLLRWTVGVAASAAAVAAALGLLGNSALSASASARRHGNLPRAAEEARRAKSWMPWSPEPWSALGRAQLAAGLLPAARVSFRRATAKDSGDWQFWYELAEASMGRARVEALRRAARLFPRSQLAPARR